MNALRNLSPPTVLVVEDDPFLRMDAVDTIEEAGYLVYEAANADEAIAALEAHPDINVLFTDIDMPGSMDGIRLAHHVRRRWPPVRILVTSGHHRVAPGDLPEEGIFLEKPCQPSRMMQMLRSLASERQAA